jgi:hypothetical protein
MVCSHPDVERTYIGCIEGEERHKYDELGQVRRRASRQGRAWIVEPSYDQSI